MRIIVVFIICGLFLTNCGSANGDTKCPGFPEYLIDYFPYHKGDTISFVNQYNDTLSFGVGLLSVTKEWSYGRDCKCDCGSPNAVLQAPTLSTGFSLFWEISAGNKYVKPFVRFELGSYYWDSGVFSKQSCLYFYDETGKDPFDRQNSTFFGDTVIIEDKSQLISRVTAVKGKGITGFSDQIQNFQWKSIKNKSY